MKNLLVVPLVLLSFSAIADARVILGSIERLTEETEVENFDSSMNGFGVRFLNFVDFGRYFGGRYSRVAGKVEICTGTQCVSADTDIRQTTFSGELGWNFGNWTPFLGLTQFVDESEGESSDNSGYFGGTWYELDKFMIRGTIGSVQEPDAFGSDTWVSGGLLFQMDNGFVLGAEIGKQTQGDDNGFSFSLQIGRTF